MVSNKKITIYMTESCPYCQKALAWLESHHISYEKIIVPLARSERTILNQFAQYFPDDIRGVPVIVVKDTSGKEHYYDDEENPEFQQLINTNKTK